MDKRQYTRVIFPSPVEIRQGENSWHGEILDLSLQGVLVSKPINFVIDKNLNLLVSFKLEDIDEVIIMEGRISHSDDQHIGIQCKMMDIDSASQLRRLIELNVGDSELLNRNFEALTAP
ncbi:PilZ domain-containing protein [Alteromonadaceae bacterium BrNp21-10]|nr:PilZ domain-containing protein [Alteromonadaceae bacterium BrNp21-10]